jgi:hypothetical protein
MLALIGSGDDAAAIGSSDIEASSLARCNGDILEGGSAESIVPGFGQRPPLIHGTSEFASVNAR